MIKKKLTLYVIFYIIFTTTLYSLDTSFNPSGINTNTAGTVITPPNTFSSGSSSAEGSAIAIQSDGKIVVAGNITDASSSQDSAISRYNTDGSLDTSFNGNGTVFNSFAENFTGVAIQSNQNIVAVGYTATEFAIARYNTNGTLDTTFNGTGMVTTSFIPPFGVTSSVSANAVAIQPNDQKILVAGTLHTSSVGQYELLIARYNTNGSLDTTFNGTGFINIPGSTFGFAGITATSISLQSDNKIIIGATFGPSAFALARLNTNGTLDTTFNPGSGAGFNGVEVTEPSAFGTNGVFADNFALAVQDDDKILAGGYFQDTSGNQSFAIARYNQNGTLDTSFNGTGTQVTQAGITTSGIDGIGIQSTGNIVVAGFADDISGNFVVALARYTTNGILDTTFGTNGILYTSYLAFNANSDAEANAVAIQSDDKIVIAGFADANTTPSSTDSFAVARYLSEIPISTTAVCIFSLNTAIIDKYGIAAN